MNKPRVEQMREALEATTAALERHLEGVDLRGVPSRSGWFIARRAMKQGRAALSAPAATEAGQAPEPVARIDAHQFGTVGITWISDQPMVVGTLLSINRIAAATEAPPEQPAIPPRFITFTGADERTSIEGMAALARQYPIEWGILFSPNRQGKGRYPPLSFVGRLLRAEGLHLSAHLCGGHSRDVIERGASELDLFIADGFERAQINSAAQHLDVERIAAWGATVGARPILQCRGSFPGLTATAWLYDKSGGKGIVPVSWPAPHPTQISGYAGGIGPDNVRDVLRQIEASDYWIDMESGVRDEHDRFSLEKCRAVCEAVYGPARPAEQPAAQERAEPKAWLIEWSEQLEDEAVDALYEACNAAERAAHDLSGGMERREATQAYGEAKDAIHALARALTAQAPASPSLRRHE